MVESRSRFESEEFPTSVQLAAIEWLSHHLKRTTFVTWVLAYRLRGLDTGHQQDFCVWACLTSSQRQFDSIYCRHINVRRNERYIDPAQYLDRLSRALGCDRTIALLF